MKKISTLGFGILFSLASFAYDAPSRLTVSADGNAVIKVTVDGNRFDQSAAGSNVVFDLQPGYHSVNVYQVAEKRYSFFNHSRGNDFRLLYTANVNIKPLFITNIIISRFGGARINEQPMRDTYNERGYGRSDENNYRHEHDYSSNGTNKGNDNYERNNGYNNSSSFNRIISNTDFFAAERVMDRENDNGRLLYAKRVMDENWLTSDQVKDLARYFSFDGCRFDFIKYAYSKTIDKGNFSVVCNAFTSAMAGTR